MKYVVSVTRTTGKPLEEYTFEDIEGARAHYHYLSQTTSHQRVLVLLVSKPTLYEEHIIDVDYKEGISYNIPKVDSGLVNDASSE